MFFFAASKSICAGYGYCVVILANAIWSEPHPNWFTRPLNSFDFELEVQLIWWFVFTLSPFVLPAPEKRTHQEYGRLFFLLECALAEVVALARNWGLAVQCLPTSVAWKKLIVCSPEIFYAEQSNPSSCSALSNSHIRTCLYLSTYHSACVVTYISSELDRRPIRVDSGKSWWRSPRWNQTCQHFDDYFFKLKLPAITTPAYIEPSNLEHAPRFELTTNKIRVSTCATKGQALHRFMLLSNLAKNSKAINKSYKPANYKKAIENNG